MWNKLIKIDKCTDSMMWYRDFVGQCFPLVREYDDVFMSLEPSGLKNIVLKSDAHIVESMPDTTVMTDNQKEVLDILQEECAELIQSISKLKRFGLVTSNVKSIQQEIADVNVMLGLLILYFPTINDYDYSAAKARKIEKLKTFSSLQDKLDRI